MIRPTLLTHVLIAILCMPVRAQVSDDFSSPDFSAWQGDDSLFFVNAAGELQLNGSVTKDASLSTPFLLKNTDTIEWSFYTRFMLSPSTQNFSRFYIWSSGTDLKAATNGYYVQLGGVAGNTDSITFYKQTGATRTKLISGRAGTVAKTNNRVRIKLIRDPDGAWSLFSDTSGGNRFVLEGESVDTTFTGNGHAGWFIRYSAGNAKNHYLDNIYVGPLRRDTIAPRIAKMEIVDEKRLLLFFTEQPDTSSLAGATYQLNGSLPASVLYDDQQKVSLVFQTALINKTTNVLKVTGVKDEAGNTMDTNLSFLYHVPGMQDLLISEFFPDPSPVVGLPESEFIELYNNSNLPVNLEGWKITDGSTIAILPSYILDVASFVCICAVHDTSLFNRYGPALGVNVWPSLNNTSDTIRVLSPAGGLIHEVVYHNKWYRDDSKDDGGYSIEMISPLQLCKGAFNYVASTANEGGSPGRVNSVWSLVADTIAPGIWKAEVMDSNTLMLLLNEPIETPVLTTFFSLAPYVVHEVLLKGSDTIWINITGVFEANTTISCFINGIKDCSGNELIENVRVSYVVPEPAGVFDVVINEIMTAPPHAGNILPAHEYIELYNRSKKIISLKNWSLEDASENVLLDEQILYPDSFVILCAKASHQAFQPFGEVLPVDGFLSLGNDEDVLILRDETGAVVHSVNYKRSFHTDAIRAAGGWSLEMKDTKKPCTAKENWTSSSDVSGGTPGRKNAVTIDVPDLETPELVRVYPVNDTVLYLYFNEGLHPESTINQPEIKSTQKVKSMLLNDPYFRKAEVLFDEKMETGKLYQIGITGVSDCAGNEITKEVYFNYGLPQTPDSHDLALNELLFNPFSGGADFVEIVNRSNKVLDLKNVWIANTNEQNEVKEFYALQEEGLMLLPYQYVVFTEDPSTVLATYHTSFPSMVLASKMPSFPDDKGCVLLTCSSGFRYDEVCYDEQMHFALLDEKDGVSLERVSTDRPSNDRSNWTSASYTVGYATPAYRNSQHDVLVRGEKLLTITPEVFSPDGDGYHDLIHFSYRLGGAQNMGSISIYNDQGLVVKQLVKNALLGSEGLISWDGITDSGNKAGIGIYLVYFECFDMQGHTTRYKTHLVVAAKW